MLNASELLLGTAGLELMQWTTTNDTVMVSGKPPLRDLGSPSISYWKLAMALVVLFLTWEQAYFLAKRRRRSGKMLPGPSYAVPLVGGVVQMVLDPYKFWEDQRKAAFPGLSYNSILGKLMVFSTDVDVSRRMLSVNDESSLLMAVHPSAKAILGPNNLAFMHGPAHKAIRKSFLALFTRKALGTYVELQDGVVRAHIADWLAAAQGREIEIRHFIRDMNAATSQHVFAGPYLDDGAEREKFSAAFMDMTQGFLAFPLCLPGTQVWKGKQGRLFILGVLRKAAARSKAALQAGVEPRCLMDFWALRCLEEIAESEAAGEAPPGHTSDEAMADTIMDFLFASQDASTASLVWLTAILAQRPDVLQKVREEQARLRPEASATITGDVLNQMTYSRQVVKEVLRYRPPAPMVPQITQAEFPLTEDYTAPKGALLMPSLIAASMQGFTDAHAFDPDRFGPERKEDMTCAKNFLTFGCGPHYCVGREYASNHLIVYLAILATSCDWTRRRTEASADDASNWLYLPTIYPHDSLITLHPRGALSA
ncbi:cytochrome P450, C-22 desaturase [Coccomyxa subellipsoidea C-169]|uniref:C-22 sterol desaturase n=1 Tax=Coccomyxa subellipsoidea (strain C-169) TaxID=574566 RepID=I0YWT0_COCSC|nr:cytochrome P450, C-22 desaturase [Coccomyxa subellipsoidea C-169]EIE22849.1 cytochrome P450, C-22 desaturase [Coccomyxa subellipsoidea C-169]|eukprot:XP_005647393.1 cytochrome P450, C-22 desaturase [Coccomyxa subellipsoidea C-169]